MRKILKVLAVPILIGYLTQKYVNPPKAPEIKDLHENIQKWYSKGEMIEVSGYEMFVRKFPFTGKNKPGPTIVLIHGFPSSSYDYHKVGIDKLQNYGPVIVYDHVGFGFSEKPKENFTFSIFELAEYSIMLFKKLGLADVICIGHDMGDTVLAELVKRRHRGTLPDFLNIKGVAFTNGGINFKYAKLRLAQHLLRNPYFGPGLNRLLVILQPHFPKLADKSYNEIWGSTQDLEERQQETDIQCLHALNNFKDGSQLLHKSIWYLNDRDAFEYSWHEAFSKIDIPSAIIWGDEDAVAPAIIGETIQAILPGSIYRHKDGVGHFLMLEDPDFWTRSVLELINSVKTYSGC